MAIRRLPNVPNHLRREDKELHDFLLELIRIIELSLQDLDTPARDGWRGTNTDGTRTVDASAATADQVRKALAQLIEDFKSAGRLAG